MSNQMLVDNLLEDLSLEQQQSLAGGQSSDDGDEDGETPSRGFGETRRYRVRSIGIISVRRLS